jgi:hypothetical protein
MSERQRLIHPIDVLWWALAILWIATLGLALSGFLFTQPRLYLYAKRFLLITIAVSMLPLVAAMVGVVIERIRGNR